MLIDHHGEEPVARFHGPLQAEQAAWTTQALGADCSAALAEPAEEVIRRRRGAVAADFERAAGLLLCGRYEEARAAGFRAVAGARGLALFADRSRDRCLDCVLLATACPAHAGRRADDLERRGRSIGSVADRTLDRPAGDRSMNGPPFDGPPFDGPPFDGPPFDGPPFDGPQWRRFGQAGPASSG